MNILTNFKILLNYIWQLPQNICGLIWYLFNKKKIVSSENRNGSIIHFGTFDSVSLGKYIFITDKRRDLEWTIEHELIGHGTQSKILGWLYLLIIGLPSAYHRLIHYNKCSTKNYFHFYTEKWANKLAKLGIDSNNNKIFL